MRLKVSSCPSQDLVYENCLFISPDDSRDFGYVEGSTNYAEIHNPLLAEHDYERIVYVVKKIRSMEPGRLGMSKIARQACKTNTGDNVEVTKFVIPQDRNFNLIYAKFALKCLAGYIEISEDELTEIINAKLKENVLSRGAIFLFDINGMGPMSATVSLLKVADLKSKENEDFSLVVDRGVITRHTFFELDNKSKTLKLNRSNDGHKISLFGPKWKYSDMGIGGLDVEFTNIFRRAFASRTIPPNIIKKLGVEHVRGLLLFGPPGTGKTLIARQIGKMLHGREPKLVNGPEILNKYVGQSEENIRALFADAEEDFKANGENSELHIIIFDEIDAICKQRGTASGNTGVHDTVVNQLLSKMDGVHSLNNILVIGMTNRKDMIDTALLRPGRFEVLVEIGLPDKAGREEIFKIHTKNMRENGFLGDDVDLEELAERTKNFSGAEIAGLIKSATSFAYYGNLNINEQNVLEENVRDLKIDRSAFLEALKEVKSAFGVSEEDLKLSIGQGIISYSGRFEELKASCQKMISHLENSVQTCLLTILLEGPTGTGTTALAAHLAIESKFPFTKIISPGEFIGWDDSAKCFQIRGYFEDAYKSPISLLVLDNIERLLGYVDIGPRFSNLALQTILVLLKKTPPVDLKTEKRRKLCIIGTTSSVGILKEMGLTGSFMAVKTMPLIEADDVEMVFKHCGVVVVKKELEKIKEYISLQQVGILQLLNIMEMAKYGGNEMDYESFVKSSMDFGM